MTDAVKLPPMPEPDEITHYDYGLLDRGTTRAFSEERMRAYAIQAVMQEREQIAKLADLPTEYDGLMHEYISACEERDHLRALLSAQTKQKAL